MIVERLLWELVLRKILKIDENLFDLKMFQLMRGLRCTDDECEDDEQRTRGEWSLRGGGGTQREKSWCVWGIEM
jgi:hypothetical protein